MAMDIRALQQIQDACFRLYGQNTDDRFHAEKILAYSFPTFSESTFTTISNASPPTSPIPSGIGFTSTSPTESIHQCQIILEKLPNVPYCQTFIAAHIRKLVSSHFPLFSLEQKLELRSFILNYIGRNIDMPPYVTSSLSQIFTLITKLGWFDSDELKNPLEEMSKFFQMGTAHHVLVALNILNLLVSDMNQPSSASGIRNANKHRKTATNFRDTQLLSIFQKALKVLEMIHQKQFSSENALQDARLKEGCISLIRSCLGFDFIGANPDEASEDVGSIQIPSAWKSTIIDPSTLNLLADCYDTFNSPNRGQIMECIGMVVSARRSMFSETERGTFLKWIIEFSKSILKTRKGMDDEASYHEFCRMLARLKTVHQLTELIEQSLYPEWINDITEFTINGFGENSPSHSITYLLTFWNKVVSSPSCPRPKIKEGLEDMASRVAEAFIASRLNRVDDDDDQEFMGKEGALTNLLELFANIARMKYDATNNFMKKVFDDLGVQYQATMNALGSSASLVESQLRLGPIEAKFSWIVYLISSTIGARTPYQVGSEEQDLIDGELSCRILQLMNIHQSWWSQKGMDRCSSQLDLAYIFFFQQLRKSYIGEHALRATNFYVRLSEVLSLSDQEAILNVIIQKLGNNLKFYSTQSDVIQQTVQILNDFSIGYSSIKLLRKTPTVQYLLEHHSGSHLPFLNEPCNFGVRSSYYTALARIFFFSDDNEEINFLKFMAPFKTTLDEFAKLTDIQLFRHERVQMTLDGIFRDLRGVISAISTRRIFLLFFDLFSVVMKGLEACYDNKVSFTLLKFLIEFSTNRTQRLSFEISSANGILMFRETSKALTTYGTLQSRRVVSSNDNKLFEHKCKGYALCFNLLRASLAGRYINFGVFHLYNDPALNNALTITFQLMLEIPLSELMSRPKLADSFFRLWEVFSTDQLMALPDLDSNLFLYLMRACGEAAKSLDPAVIAQACSILDHICSFIFRQTILSKIPPHWLVRKISEYPTVLSSILNKILDVALLEDTPVQFSLSRPLLPMILLNKQYFMDYTSKLIQSQLPERRDALAKALGNLMEGVEENVSNKNRDLFTQSIQVFRRSINAQHISLIPPSLDKPNSATMIF